jgi:hypothetical protein
MYRHALPPGFILKSEKKAAEEAAKKEQISLEDFLEVEVGSVCRPVYVHAYLGITLTTVSANPLLLIRDLCRYPLRYPFAATQTETPLDPCYRRILCNMEEDPNREEASRG